VLIDGNLDDALSAAEQLKRPKRRHRAKAEGVDQLALNDLHAASDIEEFNRHQPA